uniref:Uncharacterized protein n=1 Tax=Cacopsylla melanoneura TaxID=428564 RepID=A0A8D8YRC1_9HEMI
MLVKSAAVFNFVLLFVSVLYCSVESALPEAQINAFKKQVKTQCLAKTKVDPALIDKVLAGEFADDHKLECFTKCVMDKSMVTTKGRIDWKKIQATSKAMLPPKLAKKVEVVAAVCKDIELQEDLCKHAMMATKCVYEQDQDLFKFMN